MGTSKFQNKDPFYYRFREQVVGLFVLIPLILAPIGIISLFVSSDLFSERFVLHVKLEHPARIRRGNSVSIMEQKVGFVRSVNLNAKGHLDIEMSIEEKYRHFIRENSTGLVKQEQAIMGDWMVDISIGDPSLSVVKSGDTLNATDFFQIENMIQRLTQMSINASEILNTIATGQGMISRLLSDEEFSYQIENLLFEGKDLITSLNTAVPNLTPILEDAHKAVTSLDNLGIEGVKMTEKLTYFAEKAAFFIDTLYPVVDLYDSLAKRTYEVPPVMEESFHHFARTLEELETILKALQKHWLIRRRINKIE